MSAAIRRAWLRLALRDLEIATDGPFDSSRGIDFLRIAMEREAA